MAPDPGTLSDSGAGWELIKVQHDLLDVALSVLAAAQAAVPSGGGVARETAAPTHRHRSRSKIIHIRNDGSKIKLLLYLWGIFWDFCWSSKPSGFMGVQAFFFHWHKPTLPAPLSLARASLRAQA